VTSAPKRDWRWAAARDDFPGNFFGVIVGGIERALELPGA
jgi:hypothetical protein